MIQTRSSILCALCGIKFNPQESTICLACTMSKMQEQRQKRKHTLYETQPINLCRFCLRFQRPPWINCQRESQEMLSILLKKVKGLNKVKLVDAKFVWCEPHSKRMKVKIVIQKEIAEGGRIKVEETQVLEFIEVYTQCPECKKKFTPHDWNTVVQLRQFSQHKRTVLNLEQQVLKKGFGERMIKVEQVENGIDMFFKSVNHGQKFVDFVKSCYPISIKSSKQLISHNQRDNTSNVKTSICLTLPKICRDDLVMIPRKLSKQLGSCCELLLCTKIGASIHMLDIVNFRKLTISATQYFHYETELTIYSLKVFGKEFQVLDCEIGNSKIRGDENNQNYQKTYLLTLTRSGEFQQVYARGHFEEECGNELVGFQLKGMEFDGIKNCPDLLLVRRVKKQGEKDKIKNTKNNQKQTTQDNEGKTENKQPKDKIEQSGKEKQKSKTNQKDVQGDEYQEEDWHSIDGNSEDEIQMANMAKLESLGETMKKDLIEDDSRWNKVQEID